MHELRSRVSVLEAALETHGIALQPERKQEPVAAVQIERYRHLCPLRKSWSKRSRSHRRFPAFPISAKPPVCASLENQIGSQWFNRIGILAVLVGMALFLKLAIDNHWIGPLGRVLIGLFTGIGFIAWSKRFKRQGYAAFAYSLKAIGSGILYLSLWAAFSLFHLMPAGVAFAAMVLVTAFNGFMA